MPPDVIERAIEPFFTTKPPGAGTGLGLSMIYGFVRQSGGHLKIYSEVGFGTTVRLYLPRSHDAATPAKTPLAEQPAPTGHESVLLVEDNADVRQVAAQQWGDLGYSVREASNAPEALRLLDAGERFDLLFTDVVMPEGMTGFQLAEAARQRQPEIKLLFATGYARVEPRDS